LPDLGEIDWLVVMGGPMNIYEEDRYPWLIEEKRLIETAVAAGKTVLGICLGAQLIASVLGAAVVRNRVKEIGWFPVTATATAERSRVGRALPTQLAAYHWHGDTFELPVGAVQLARSRACEQQGFSYQDRVVALQFHLETTPESARALIEHCAGEIQEGPYIQSPEEMLAEPGRFLAANRVMASLLATLEEV